MEEKKRSFAELTINTATEGGHFVMQNPSDRNSAYGHPVLFAGTLEQCLDFVRRMITQ